MQRTQISLTEEERRLLDAESARTGRSLSALIRHAVDVVYRLDASADEDLVSLESTCGAWSGRTADPSRADGEGAALDGAGWVEQRRSGRRLANDGSRE